MKNEVSKIQLPVLIFDLGGVLLDWSPYNLYNNFFDGNKNAVDGFLKEIDFFSWNYKQDKGRLFSEGVAELSARFPHYSDLIRAYDERWEESISGPIQSTVDLLVPLKEKGHLLYGLTNWSDEKFHLVNQKFPFFDLFEDILVSGAVNLAKPDPRIFELLLEKIGYSAFECIFIDDSLVNINSARKMGFMTILYESSEQMVAELENLSGPRK